MPPSAKVVVHFTTGSEVLTHHKAVDATSLLHTTTLKQVFNAAYTEIDAAHPNTPVYISGFTVTIIPERTNLENVP